MNHGNVARDANAMMAEADDTAAKVCKALQDEHDKRAKYFKQGKVQKYALQDTVWVERHHKDVHDNEHHYAQRRRTRTRYRGLLPTLSTTHTSLTSLLRRAPSHATAPPPPPPATRPHAAQHPAPHTVPQHRLTVDRRPVVPPPPTPLPGPHPAHVVFTPTSRAADILPLLAATPPGHRILLAANPSVLSEVPIEHAHALHVRPLLPNLHAAYAPGTPVDPSVWDSQ